MREETGEDGTITRKLVYIGNTYSANIPEEKYRRRKVLFALLSACCVLLFLLANLQNTQSNIAGILPAFGIIAVIPLFVQCYGCICGLWKKRVMTRTDYVEHSMMVKFGGFLTAALACLNFVWHSVFLIDTALPDSRGKEALVTVFWLAIAAVSLFLWITELRTEYVVRNRYGTVIHQEHFKRR